MLIKVNMLRLRLLMMLRLMMLKLIILLIRILITIDLRGDAILTFKHKLLVERDGLRTARHHHLRDL